MQWKQDNMPHINWVIDADVARSAGETENPISMNCRNFLESVKENKHCLVMSANIKKEWDKHQSKFSIGWRTAMQKKRLITYIKVEENEKFIDKIDDANITQDQKNIAKKDAHLIDAALKTDRTIASGDDRARKVFCIIAETENNLQNINWTNPKMSNILVLSWWDSPNKLPQEWKLLHKTP